MPRRRTFLKLGILGAAGAGVSGLALGALGRGRPRAGLRVLTGGEARVVAAFADALFTASHFPLRPEAVGVVEAVDEYLALLPRSDARGVQLLWRALQWSGLAHGGRFSRLDLPGRLRVIEDWEQSGSYHRRAGFRTLKYIAALAYFDSEQVRRSVGWYLGCSP